MHDLRFLTLGWILLDRAAKAGKPDLNGGPLADTASSQKSRKPTSYPLAREARLDACAVDAAAALAVVLALDGFPFADAGMKDR
ncbi:MAG: hypothetical protein OXE73_13755 [Gammaproteobacteria bacterium]|nr:hypothetical protein [Gammaproteobacteria bacterium]